MKINLPQYQSVFKQLACILALFITILNFSSCSSKKLQYVGKDQWLKKISKNSLNSSEYSYETDQFLISHALKKRFDEDPESVIKLLAEQVNHPDRDLIYEKPTERETLAVLVELCTYMAKGLEGKKALKYWVSCNFYSYKYMFDPAILPKLKTFSLYYNFNAMIYYNISAGEILRYICDFDVDYKREFTVNSVTGKILFKNYKSDLPYTPDRYDELILGPDYTTDSYESHSFSPGIGIPAVASKEKSSEDVQGTGRATDSEVIPFTFIVKYDSFDFQKKIISAQPELYYYFNDEYANIEGEEIPISKDYTNALARIEDMVGVSDFVGKMHLLFPAAFNGGGLYMLSGYQKDKIPVILVHGLMSDPRSMFKVLNSLMEDTRLRQNYQFWLYYYSTGEQIIAQATRFRQSLINLKKSLGKDADNEKFNNTILVGYSLGGVISRLSVQESHGKDFKKKVLGKDYKNIDFSQEEKEFLNEYLVFEALPFVKRVIFVVAPHRGATMASWGISKFFSELIVLPSKFDDMRKGIVDKLAEFTGEEPERGNATVLRDLAPNSWFIETTIDLPYKKGVVLNSIIGDKDQAGKTGGTDGVVDYWSSHLDNVESEVVIKSDHYAVQNRDCIYEIKKILLRNLKELNLIQSHNVK